MKHAAAVAFSLALLCASCASTPDPDQPVASACAGMDCFRESEIRDVEFLDARTLIAFVGPQRCAYRMELDGNYCDFSAGPTIDFEPERTSQILMENGVEQRICLQDRPYVSDPYLQRLPAQGNGSIGANRRPRTLRDLVRGDRISAAANRGDQCRVQRITPLNDDELLELYTDKGAQSPLPPVGSGQVSVQGDESEQDAAQGPPPAGSAGEEESADAVLPQP